MKFTIERFVPPCNCRSVGECHHGASAEYDALGALVDAFAAEMKAKLRRKIATAPGGWDKDGWGNQCRTALHAHITKGDPVDVANFAAFLWNMEASTAASGDTYTRPPYGWTCFHCGETFHTIGGAQDHFGETPDETPACKLKIELGGERGLIMELRKSTSLSRRLRSQVEDLEYRAHAAQQGYLRIGGATGAAEAFFAWDSMQGRALAAEAIVADIAARWPALVEASRRRFCQRRDE